MRRIFAIVLGFAACHVAALDLGDRVDNFELFDHLGQAHELHYLSDHRAVALMAHSTACESFASMQARFESVAGVYATQGVAFLMVNADGYPDRRPLDGATARLPVLLDGAQVVGASLGLTAAGEVLLVDTGDWRLRYRGGPDGVDNAVASLLGADQTPIQGEVPEQCPLTYPAPDGDLTYVDDVAPILRDNCVTCHRAGGIGPWAMTDYNMVRGFAPMIREVVRTQRMPPWHADPVIGHFANDRSLASDDIRTLVHWAEAGAPRGEGTDPLLADAREWPEWTLGDPDLVVDIPAYDVPATGVVEYQYQFVRNPLDRDVWVRATDILPGDRSALHHVITTFRIPTPDNPRGRRGGSLGGYVPGMAAREYPDSAGTLLPAGAVIVFQMHYTPYGKAVTDQSRLGLYFHDETPQHRMANAVLMNTDILIPAGAKAHSEFAEQIFDQDILLYSLLPHAHYRGRASEFRAFYPDGEEELLLSVPNYDFNWQTTYQLAEPKVLPAGTRVVHTTWWDNSVQNPANPDPDRDVPWGLQSWDEMLFGSMSYRLLEDGPLTAAAGADLSEVVADAEAEADAGSD